MKRIYLMKDTREAVTYKEFIGVKLKKIEVGEVIVKRVNLFDGSIKAFRKQKVALRVLKVTPDAIEVEVI